MAAYLLLLLLTSLAVQQALSTCPQDYCGEDIDWFPRDPFSVNISLLGRAYFYFRYDPARNIYDCPGAELHLRILRADGETELYTTVNETNMYIYIDELYTDRGIQTYGDCCSGGCCEGYLQVNPTDLRYDGAQIAAVLDLPECPDSPYSTGAMTLHIQGYLDPPTEVRVEQVSVDSVNVSWSPPFTLEGVPILHYTVYITSSTGYSEAMNTTQTEVSLHRPCSDTTYQVSGWNEVGEGETSSPVTYIRGKPTSPTNMMIINTSTEVQISWTAPADWEDCITRYSIYITDSSGTVSITNTTDSNTSYTVIKPCSDVWIEVSGWSEGGQGERSSPEEFYADLTLSQTTVKKIHTLSSVVICASCSFITDSEAEGCAVELESEAHTYLFNMSHSTSGGGELSESVLDCFTVGEAGEYSVHVYEIQCNGEPGYRSMELPNVTVEGDASGRDSTIEDDNDEAVTALAVLFSLAVVGIAVAVSVYVGIIFVKKWRIQQSNTSVGDGDTEARAVLASGRVAPPQFHSYEQVDPKPNNEEIEFSTITNTDAYEMK